MLNIIRLFIRMFLRPQILFSLIAIWYKSPQPWKLIKNFFSENVHVVAAIYGIITAITLILSLSEHNMSKFWAALLTSISLLLIYPLFLALFNRVHYPASARINWRKTLAPAQDLCIIWAVVMVFTCVVYLFVLLISKK